MTCVVQDVNDQVRFTLNFVVDINAKITINSILIANINTHLRAYIFLFISIYCDGECVIN